MAFVPGLSKSQVEKVILNYAEIAPETMQLIDDLSAQINDPNDPAAALIGRMAVAEGDIDSLESSISSLSSSIDSKAPLSSPTISNPTLTGTVTLPNASIANNKLQNSSISINGTSVPLGGNAIVVGTALPSQTNNAGKALVTNGSTLSWETVDVSNLNNPTIITGSETTLYEITGLNYLGSYGMPGSQYFRPDTEPAGMAPIQDLNISGPFSVVISGSNSVFDGTWEGNAIESWAVTFYGPTPEGNFPYVANTENFTFSIIQGNLATISPTEISYLDGVTSNIQAQLNTIPSQFDSVVLNQIFSDAAVLSLAAGTVYYSNTQPATSYAVQVFLYNDATKDPMSDPTFSLNSAVPIGKAVTFVILQKNTSTGIYFNQVNAEIFGGGSTINLKWQGGSAPTAPNLNATDIYTFTVLKTADNVFDVFADVAKFA